MKRNKHMALRNPAYGKAGRGSNNPEPEQDSPCPAPCPDAPNRKKQAKAWFSPFPFLCVLLCLCALGSTEEIQAQQTRIGLLKYNGGGDWYANPTSLPNLIAFANEQAGMRLDPLPSTVEVGMGMWFSARLKSKTCEPICAEAVSCISMTITAWTRSSAGK